MCGWGSQGLDYHGLGSAGLMVGSSDLTGVFHLNDCMGL